MASKIGKQQVRVTPHPHHTNNALARAPKKNRQTQTLCDRDRQTNLLSSPPLSPRAHPPTTPRRAPPHAKQTKTHQRKKRYSEAGVVFSEAYLERVESFLGGSQKDGAAAAAGGGGGSAMAAEAGTYKRALRTFTTLGSTYAEMESLKGLIEMLVVLGRGDRGSAITATPSANGSGASGGSSNNNGGVTKETEKGAGGALADDSDAGCIPDPAFEEAVGLFLALLFCANSRPLHRHLITSVRRFAPKVGRCKLNSAFHTPY
jgi:hypothetical protein